MRSRDRSLIEEIQRDALSPDASIAATLRKLIALGGEAGSTELRDWASRELRGYAGSDVDLPDYRRPVAVIHINGFAGNAQITGQQISPRDLPEAVRDKIDEAVPLNQPIGEIEAMLERSRANNGYLNLTLPHSQDLVKLMNYDRREQPYQQITHVYWSLSTPAIQGVIDQVRTTLVELVAEMRAGMPSDAEIPSAEVADQAVHVAVHGKRARVNVTTAQAGGSGSHQVIAAPPQQRGKSFWAKVGAAIVGIATIVGTLIALAVWQGWSV